CAIQKSERTAPFRVVRDPEIGEHSGFQRCAAIRKWSAQRVSALCAIQKLERAEIIEISSLGWRPRAQPIYHARKNLYSVVKDHRLPNFNSFCRRRYILIGRSSLLEAS